MILTHRQRVLIGQLCNLTVRGPSPYCYAHYSLANDLVACRLAETVAEQILSENGSLYAVSDTPLPIGD